MGNSGHIAKCVILARGLGTRMRRADGSVALDASQLAVADAGMKAMIPVGRPFLDYVLSSLADAEFEQVCLVIGPEHEAVREYYTSTVKPERIRVSFATQQEPLGTANAVLSAEKFANGDEFLVINSDNYYPAEAVALIQSLGQPGTVLFSAGVLVHESNIPEERIRTFAYCVVDGDGYLADIVEKPDAAAAGFDTAKLVSMNFWRFGSEIFAACREVPQSSRGEYELPEAVRLAIQQGAKFKVAVCREGVLDLSRRSDIAEVAARLRSVEVRL
jgi:glucose-1-phosphate thymidylyltransferase